MNPSPEPNLPPPRPPRRPELTEAMRRHLVERRIVEAMEAGKFDNLPGTGRPLHIDQPPAKNAELWWVLRLLRQANLVPDEIRYRKQIDELRARLAGLGCEAEVRRLVGQINQIVRKLNIMGTNAIPTTLAPLDEQACVAQWRALRGNRP